MAHSSAALLIAAATLAAPVEQRSERPAPTDPAATDPAATAPSLDGTFPDTFPNVLNDRETALTALGPDWADWAAEASESSRTLFDPEATAAQQREAIAAMRVAVRRSELAAEKPPFRAIRPALLEVRGAFERWAGMGATALDALADARDLPLADARRAANARLADALAGLRAELATIPGGAAWLPVARADRLEEIVAGETGPSVHRTLAALVYDLEYPPAYDADQEAFLYRPVWRRLLAAAELRLALSPDPETSGPGADGDAPRGLDAAAVAVRHLVAAFERFERDGSDESAQALRAAAADLAALSPAAGRGARDFIDEFYDRDNYRVTIGEGFLKRFIAQSRRERGSVSRVIFGSRVTGTQRTDVEVDVDVVPDAGVARFDVTLTGTARTDTIATTPQARVNTLGRHEFEARKTMIYDGTRFRAGRTVVEVDPNLRNTRIRTAYDDLLGGALREFVQRQAYAEAARRQPAALLNTRRSLEETLRPQLDRQLNEQFDVVNLRAGGLFRRRAARLGLAPSRESISSTDRAIRIRGRLSNDDELAAPPPPPQPALYDGVVVQVHQTAVNNALDRLNLAGRALTPDELGVVVTDFFSDLFATRIPPPAPIDAGGQRPPTLRFADADPVRVAFEADTAIVTLNAGFTNLQYENGEPRPDVPVQSLTAYFRIELTDSGELRVIRETLALGMIGRVLGPRLEKELPKVTTYPAETVLATDARTRVPLRVASVTIADGWVTAVQQ